MGLKTYIVLTSCVGLLLPFSVSAASLYIDPAKGTYGPGDTFVAMVRVDNQGECINAAHIEITYPTDRLRAVDFGRGGSVFSLWVEEPKIDTDKSIVTFSGGIPGGYCGKIQGDPGESNVLGKIVFTVLKTEAADAQIRIAPASVVYLNDGLGTQAKVATRVSDITLVATSVAPQNPWITEVGSDIIPPDAFTVEVQSTEGVFGGEYYIVFSTVDKQSGVDHFEIFEKGVWKRVTSPYKLSDQSLRGIRVKAIDKAGNERLGNYVEGAAPPSHVPRNDLLSILLLIALLVIVAAAKIHMDRKKKESAVIDLSK